MDADLEGVARSSRTMIARLPGALRRRPTFTVLCAGSIAATLYLYKATISTTRNSWRRCFWSGAHRVILRIFPLYLPELFPTAIRATGQGFSYNFGRILAAIGGLQTANLTSIFGGSFAKAGSVVAAIYLVGMVVVWLGPETKGKPLPE